MYSDFEKVIQSLIGDLEGDADGRIDVSGQFRAPATDGASTFRKLNSAFLIQLAGQSHPDYSQAGNYLENLSKHASWKEAADFFSDGLSRIREEFSSVVSRERDLSESLARLISGIASTDAEREALGLQGEGDYWGLFFPEGAWVVDSGDAGVEDLRRRREIRITRLNPEPIRNPVKEILFTSNILLTLPPESRSPDDISLDPAIRRTLRKVTGEEQSFWYDHPIQIGVEAEHNEVIYGLKGLSEALGFEKDRGTVVASSRLQCLLSVSVTHKGLQPIAREYIAETLKADGSIRDIDAYVFTEIDAGMLLDEVLVPAAKRYGADRDHSTLKEVFGTDGEYGRHYSFLKAVSALWQVFIAREIKATFKIDLDQVFPQKELVQETGESAFEHFKTPLWGAEGLDYLGREVELGMIAGALVNQRDIHHGIFTPDVDFPSAISSTDERVFFSKMPQALSTEAEMMTRYGEGGLDGKTTCIQRIHVTGGTNGILVSALRKHRPFTPVFVGRAEDQAYLLSVLYPDSGPALRYVHKDGLIMRHDKEALAGGAIKAAAMGKLVGDYVRILTFSSYARALPWGLDKIKEAVDPFTGCFISKIPQTLVYLRCALKAASFFEEGGREALNEGRDFLKNGVDRLSRTLPGTMGEPNPLEEVYKREKEGWDLYYDLLEWIERDLKKDSPFALELKKKAAIIVKDCRIRT